MTTITAIPPAIVLFGLALLVTSLPRRFGHALAAAGTLATGLWVASLPAGAHLPTLLFGFDAVLLLVDPYSRLLGVTFGFIATIGVTYSYTTGADRRQTAYALAYLGTGLGAVLAGDWLTLVVFWELMAVCATLLIWHRANDRRPGIRYAIYHELGGLLLMAGVLLHYGETGTFLYNGGITVGLPAILVALGIGLNAGFLGLHVWLVDTYPRTHVATSVVLAAVTTKVGAFTILRAFPDGNLVLAYVGGAMVLFGVTFAILQTDMRRLLSYHIVSQVGYIVAGLGAGTALASAGAVTHILNNILYKSLLFMVAGVLISRTGRESLKQLHGSGRRLPLTAAVFTVAALSISGIPGFNGFVSKGMVLDGVEKAGLDALWWLLLVGGVGTVVSFAKFGYYAFRRGTQNGDTDDNTTHPIHDQPDTDTHSTPPNHDHPNNQHTDDTDNQHTDDTDNQHTDDTEHNDLGPIEIGALGSVALLCVVLGLFPGIVLGALPATDVAGAKPFAAKQFLKAGGVALAGLVVFAGIRTRLSHVTPVPDLDVVYHPLGRRVLRATVGLAGSVEDGIATVGGVFGTSLTQLLAGRAREDPGGGPGRSRESIGAGMLAMTIVLVLLLAILVLA